MGAQQIHNDDDNDYKKAVAKDIEVTSLRAANYIIGQWQWDETTDVKTSQA